MAKTKRLNYSEFMERFGWRAYRGEPGTSRMPPPGLDSLQIYVPELRVLAAAASQNCPSAFSHYLQRWLCNLGIKTPEAVFRPIRYGSPGLRGDPATDAIYILWIAIGEPSLTSTKLAKERYKAAYSTAKVDERKRMVDRLRRAVERVQARASNS